METEEDKFISVIKENQRLIYKVCACYCFDKEDRKDLQQEILIQLWKSFKHYDGRTKISTWFYRISINTAISFYRKGKKHYDKRVPINESVILKYQDETSSDKDENIKMLYQYINCLNEFDKALILLYLDENKYTDIAEIMGITESNVATKIYRIKQNLKNQFFNI